jgi:PA14 domain
MPRRTLHVVAVTVLAVVVTLGGAAAETVSGLKPAEPHPTPEQLAPGLAVQYTYAIVNSISELKGRKFEPGPALSHLEWRMGNGTVLTSKSREGVGAMITGFIQFDKAGTYGVDITSNDGVRVEIGGKLIHEDPGVHSDTSSDRIDVKIDKPGWYPVNIVYFQKRHTATLVLRWAAPGEKNMVAIPPKALAYRK